MSTIQTVTETLIRLAKQAIHPDTVLVFPDDPVRGPAHPQRHPPGAEADRRPFPPQPEPPVREECRGAEFRGVPVSPALSPRFRPGGNRWIGRPNCSVFTSRYHGSFSFTRRSPSPTRGSLNLTELVPLGGLARVNLSNLRQSSGRIRIESCPVYDGDLRDGRLIRDRTFQFHGDVTEQRTIQP